jgi:hypothetical protein
VRLYAYARRLVNALRGIKTIKVLGFKKTNILGERFKTSKFGRQVLP